MNIEEAKQILERSSKLHLQVDREPNKFDIAIEIVLAELDKEDKIIDEMAYCIDNYQICDYEITDCNYRKCDYIADDEKPPCQDCIKEYFEKKVGEE